MILFPTLLFHVRGTNYSLHGEMTRELRFTSLYICCTSIAARREIKRLFAATSALSSAPINRHLFLQPIPRHFSNKPEESLIQNYATAEP